MSTFDLDGYLAAQLPKVEALLDQRSAGLTQTPPRLLESMRYSLLAGGKRLRPILCLAFADALSGRNRAAEDAACALEYVHTYSLVHDDLPSMDNDDLRRGRPTNHKVFGDAMATLAGDALLTEAFGLLASGDEAARLALVRELAVGAGAFGMVGGQVLDIAEDRPSELGYLNRLHRLKTGALIRAACRMGAIAGGADANALEAAGVYGDAVGLAFQIADDVLDVTSDAATMGKPTGADAAAGRHTYPALLGLEKSRAMAQEQVETAIRAIAKIERTPGPLAALARYSVDRKA